MDGGIVTRYQILEHPTEHGQAKDAVVHHQMLFEHPPNLVTGDRGVHSADTEGALTAAGVKLVAIPAEGKVSEERQAALAHAPLETGVSLACGHRGEDRQPEARLRVAQK